MKHLISKVSLLTFVGFFALLTFFSCSSTTDKKPGVLRLNLASEPFSLDPRTTTDLVSVNVLRMLFEGLFRLNDTPQGIEPALAESYTISDDGKVYTFRLKASYWSNGDPVEAEDFAYAWRWILDPKNPAPAAFRFYSIINAEEAKKGLKDLSSVGIETPDHRTLVITLEKPVPYFIELTAHPSFVPVNRRIDQTNPQWANDTGTHISNGPFVLDSWQPHDKIIVKKNPNYLDADAVKMTAIELAMVTCSDTELSMFNQGYLDWAGRPLSGGLPTDSIQSLRELGQLKTGHWSSITFYAFNTKKFPFNNTNIRKALSYAINRQEIVTHILQGQDTIALGLLPTRIKLHQEPYFKDGDEQKAKELFQLGLAEQHLTLENFPTVVLLFHTKDTHLKIAQAIQDQWRKVLGINVTLEHYEWKVFIEEVGKKEFFLAGMGQQSAYNDPMAILEIYTTPNHFTNRSSWYNPYYTQLIENSHYQTLDERNKTLAEAEAIFMDEMPIIPLYFANLTHVENPRLKGVQITATGLVDFSRSYFEPF